jgi:hypothetical protein
MESHHDIRNDLAVTIASTRSEERQNVGDIA